MRDRVKAKTASANGCDSDIAHDPPPDKDLNVMTTEDPPANEQRQVRPSLKKILELVDESDRRLKAGETRVLSPEEANRRLTAVLEKQRVLLKKITPK